MDPALLLFLDLLAVAVGLLLLAVCSDTLVESASVLAARFGVPAVVVGVVVIGIGTSAPELVVSALAAADGSAAIGLGNVVGSCIANVTLVLGAAACVAPVVVTSTIVRREVPLAVAAVVALAVAVQGGLGLPEAAALGLGLVVALALLLRWAFSARTVETGTAGPETGTAGPVAGAAPLADDVRAHLSRGTARSTRGLCLLVLVGLVGTVAGAQALVEGAQGLAAAAGLSEGFIGLTVVAVGTSLPELVTAVQSVRRGESDLLVGNLMGSNLFNCLGVGAAIGVLAPGAPSDASVTTVGALLMVVVGLGAAGLMAVRRTLGRVEGVVLLLLFAACVPALF